MIVHISPYDFSTGLIDEDSRLTNVISATIERDATDETSLLESAVVKLDTSEFSKGWYAVDALTNGVRNRLGIFYFKLKTMEQESDGSFVYELEGTSVLYNASVKRVKGGYSVVKGNSGTATITSLLADCGAPLEITPFQVQKTQVFNGNVTKLGACWSVLRNSDMCIQIDDEGTINVIPTPTTVTKTITLDGGELTGAVQVSDDEVGYDCVLNGRPYDVVYLNLPKFGIDTTLHIASQSIKLENSLIAEETVKEQVYGSNNNE